VDDRDNRFDVEQMLAWERATRGQGTQAPFDPDAEITLTFPIPYGAFEECRRWVYENRQLITENETSFDLTDGVWRLKKCQMAPAKTEEGDNYAGNLALTYAKGFYSSIDWDSARIVQIDKSVGNSTDSGVTDGASDNPQLFFVVRFPYCSPDSVYSMVQSLSATTYTDKVVRGQTLSGEWNVVSAGSKLEEDGTHSIYLTLALPKYVLKAYTDLNGINQEDVIYLWNVPKDIAQNILDGWKTVGGTGASASADYSDDKKLANLTLRKKTLNKPNHSIEGLEVSCDTTQSIHLGWGYEIDDIDPFVEAHNAPMVTGSRQINVSSRGDGLFDVSIVENYVEAVAPPHFSIDIPSGNKITNRQEYGWNISITQLLALKDRLETKVLGKITSFDVTREDNCTFDYRASSITEEEQSSSILIDGDGINVVQKSYKSAADTDGHGLTSGKRKRTSARAAMSPNGLFDYEVEQQTVVEIPQKTLVGSHGNKKILYGENTEPPTSVAGFIQSAYLTTKDDGTAGHVITIKDPASPVKMENTHSSKGLTVTTVAQIGGAVTDTPSGDISSAVGVENEVQIRPDDDGSGSYVHQKSTWNPLDADVESGTILDHKNLKVIENGDPVLLDAYVTPVRGGSRNVSFKIDPVSGKLSAVIEEGTAAASSRIVDTEDDGVMKKTTTIQRNVTAAEDLGGVLGRTASNILENDYLDVIKETLEMSDLFEPVVTSRGFSRIEYDTSYHHASPTASSTKFKTNLAGELVRIRNSEVRYLEITVSRFRTVTVEEETTYSLTSLNADLTAATDGGSGGEFDSVVDMPRPGMYRKVNRTTSLGAWELDGPVDGDWRQYADTHFITETEAGTNGIS